MKSGKEILQEYVKVAIVAIVIGIALGIILLYLSLSPWSSPSVVFAQDRSNTYYAAQFAGPDVGTKVTNAQNSCSPNTAIPCIIVIDAILAGWPQGNLPAVCAQCTWMDWTHVGALYVTNSTGMSVSATVATGILQLPLATGTIQWGLNTSICAPSNGVVNIGTGLCSSTSGQLQVGSITTSGGLLPSTPGALSIGTAGAPFSLVAIGSGTNTEHRILSSSTANRIMTIPDGTAGAVVVASFTTTAAATDNVTVQGMVATGHCSLTPTNSGAAGGIASVFISAKNTNQITVTHTATAGWTFDVMCTI